MFGVEDLWVAHNLMKDEGLVKVLGIYLLGLGRCLGFHDAPSTPGRTCFQVPNRGPLELARRLCRLMSHRYRHTQLARLPRRVKTGREQALIIHLR